MSLRNQLKETDEVYFFERIDIGIKLGIALALKEHKERGVQIPVWREGYIAWEATSEEYIAWLRKRGDELIKSHQTISFLSFDTGK